MAQYQRDCAVPDMYFITSELFLFRKYNLETTDEVTVALKPDVPPPFFNSLRAKSEELD